MNTELTTFLHHHTPVTQESAIWGDGTIPLTITSYLSQELPPLDLVAAVRAIVTRPNEVLVVRDPGGYHLLPGGRRESDETLLQTLQRELLEETGWSLDPASITQIGFKHFHHQGPRPPVATIYPDFLQIIYSAHPTTYHPEAREKDGYELETFFHPLARLSELPLEASALAFLDAALKAQQPHP